MSVAALHRLAHICQTVERSGVERSGVERSGVERSGVKSKQVLNFTQAQKKYILYYCTHKKYIYLCHVERDKKNRSLKI